MFSPNVENVSQFFCALDKCQLPKNGHKKIHVEGAVKQLNWSIEKYQRIFRDFRKVQGKTNSWPNITSNTKKQKNSKGPGRESEPSPPLTPAVSPATKKGNNHHAEAKEKVHFKAAASSKVHFKVTAKITTAAAKTK